MSRGGGGKQDADRYGFQWFGDCELGKTDAITPDGATTFPKDHKIQTDKRERNSSGGACQGSAGCQLGSRTASGAVSSIMSSVAGGAARFGMPPNAAIAGESGAGWSPQTHGSDVAGSLQQQESDAAQEAEGSSRRPVIPSEKIARKHAANMTSFFTISKR
jgi:hypothetical protein